MAKAAPWTKTDAQVRKRGEQTAIRYPGSPRRKRCRLGGCALEAWLPELTR